MACTHLSRVVPDAIVCCGQSVLSAHVRRGYAPEKMVVIANGFDLGHFGTDPQKRAAVRAEFGFGEARISVVGIVGRFDPLKDHRNFVEAATPSPRSLNGYVS